MTNRSKRYLEAARQIDKEKSYDPQEAIELAKKIATTKFDETVELHLFTGSDSRQSDQVVRGVAVLPHGTGKAVRVLVFAQGEAAHIAQEAGADHIGDDGVIQRIEQGWLEFDVSIATPDLMSKIGRLGRILGRRGLMPNPKTGTVVTPEDLPRAIKEVKGGRVEFRMDRTALIHVPIGKASFDSKALLENLLVVIDNIVRSKPSGVKGQFLRSASLATTMGPSIKLDLSRTLSLKVE
ncbi:MAG: 50S ribosomal protein L1 [Chloroflexi bacterium]|nr:50S ribosomal protein L1 [Chloroflexota bacterium]